MSQFKSSKLKRVMCGILSTLTMLSGTAVAGTTMTATASAAETEAVASSASEATPATFSWDNATVYFLLTDRFNNGDTSNDNAYGRQNINVGDQRATFHGGDFAGITQKINEGYFNDLGVNAIWLTAPYEQIHGYIVGGSDFFHYSYHGYYVLDYTETDAAYGTKEEFRQLVDTAHEHGIRIVMDIVMNHAGYNSLKDMDDYGFGVLKSGWDTYYNNPGSTSNYHDYIDYNSSADQWLKWWGADWIRAGLSGYTEGGNDEYTRSLAGLPDFKTEQTKQVSLPAILQTKWTKEGTLSQKQSKYGSSNTVTGYISTWLSEWVREYGVDGFRCDTAKHVELGSWKQLKDACTAALAEWKAANPTKKLDDLPFWMTGECWDHGVYKDAYYTQGGFDSMINFDTTGGGVLAAGTVGNKYNDYANAINNDPDFNVLSYISSHDSTLARGDMYYLGSAFLMLPGAVQIYYGDETNRPYVSGIPNDGYGGAGHSLRSDMNWDSYDPELLAHWGTVGNFRNNHIAVGAGANTTLTASNGVAFGRTYDKNGISDKVAGVIGATANTSVSVDVSSLWGDGTTLENFYDESVAVVSGGKVTFNSGAHGTILIAEPDGERGRVTVTHVNQDTGATIKTEIMSGLVGESYTAAPLSTEGFTVARVSGSTTGVYSADEANVTFYYTFDSANYAYILVKHVDAETGAEIADSETLVGRIGSAYTTSPKDIKNYEVDESISTNISGTVKSGTTTATYKYNYVESTGLKVHYYNANSWSNVYLYAYNEDTAVTEYTGKWPGQAMTNDGDGWYSLEVSDAESALVIFNNGSGTQEPAGVGTKGYDAAGEVWIKNGSVNQSGKVNVKYVADDGTVLGREVLTGIADGTATYTTTAKTFTGYTLASTPSNATGKFTAETINVVYTYTSNTPSNPLVNNSSLSATSVTQGTTVTVYGKASGGTAPYTYTYSVKRASASSWTVKASDTTAESVTVTPTYAETYQVKVDVKDSKGSTVSKTLTINVSESPVTALTNNSTVSSTSVTQGSTVTITGKASGGTSPYKYAFYIKRQSASSWTLKGTEFGSSTTATFTPGYVEPYDVMVYVMDATNTTAVKTLTVNVTGLSTATLTNNSTISATTITKGSSVTITGKASGGTSPYKYTYHYKKSTSSDWSVLASKTTSTTASFTPGYTGEYIVKAYVIDSTGKTVSKTFTVTVNAAASALTNSSTVSADSVKTGTAVTVTGKATGGTSPYKYTYQIKRASVSAWTTKASNTSSTTMTFTPGYAETYNVKVTVTDAKGTTATKTMNVAVTAASTGLTNNSTISATTITKGSAVTVTAKASSGTSPYKYTYQYKRTTASDWTTLASKTSETSKTITFNYTGTYTVKAYVIDSTGKVVSKTFTVEVTAK